MLITWAHVLVDAEQELIKAKKHVRKLTTVIKTIKDKVASNEPFPVQYEVDEKDKDIGQWYGAKCPARSYKVIGVSGSDEKVKKNMRLDTLLAVRTDNPLSINNDGWLRQRPAFSGWRGMWNRIVLWNHNRKVSARAKIYNDGFAAGHVQGYDNGYLQGKIDQDVKIKELDDVVTLYSLFLSDLHSIVLRDADMGNKGFHISESMVRIKASVEQRYNLNNDRVAVSAVKAYDEATAANYSLPEKARFIGEAVISSLHSRV